MKFPFANELPQSIRVVGRSLFSPQMRADIAAHMQHVAHLQSRLNPRFHGARMRLRALKDAHRGERCVIIGNGPSVAEQDLSLLSNTPTFCLNRGYLLWQSQGLTPSYLVAVNDLVVEQFNNELAAVGCPLFVPWQHEERFSPAHFASGDDPIFMELRWHRRFFGDVTNGLWAGATVTFAAMQLAYHMGFQSAVLIGVDHRFEDKGPPNKEIVQGQDDANHFAPNYFGKGVRWNLPDLELSETAYKLAKSAYQADGRQIVDATQDGALQVFEKLTLNDAIARGFINSSK